MQRHSHIDNILGLFQQTLTLGYNDTRPWRAVRTLHQCGNRFIFDKAARWCLSSNPRKRARGADILSQLRQPLKVEERHSTLYRSKAIFMQESFEILASCLQSETDRQTLLSILYGFGHLDIEAAVPLLLPFSNHASSDIRYAATFGLASFSQDSSSITALIRLSADADIDVRDWATFAIGTQSELDTPELRDALAVRLTDVSSKVREEATAGLAKRKDERAALPLLKVLRNGSYFVHHEGAFEELIQAQPPAEGWTADTLADALYARFPALRT